MRISVLKVDNIKLRTKILIPLALTAAGVFAVAAFGATRLARVSSTASEIIERRDLAAMELAQASHLMTAAPHAVFAILLYDKDDPQREASKKEFATLVPQSVALLDHASSLLPDRAKDIAKFKKRFQTLAEDAKDAFKVGVGTPGLLHGLEIQQADLVQEGLGARLATAADMRIGDLTNEMKAFSEALLAANAKASQDLDRLANSATVSMAVAGVAATLLAGAFAMWMTTFKVARPLSRMVERMKTLAQGDLNVEIKGLGRRDEVGEMAAAVEVFKTNAVQRVELEKEAAEHRAAADAEHGRGEADKARIADVQLRAMRWLGEGLKQIADGDLTARLDSRFLTEFAKIRDDFNAAGEKLVATERAVVSSTSAIDSGAREITSASDDLSHRTEQQAASLEQTAAAGRNHRGAEDLGRGRQTRERRGRQRRRQRQEGRSRRQAGCRGDGRDLELLGTQGERQSTGTYARSQLPLGRKRISNSAKGPGWGRELRRRQGRRAEPQPFGSLQGADRTPSLLPLGVRTICAERQRSNLMLASAVRASLWRGFHANCRTGRPVADCQRANLLTPLEAKDARRALPARGGILSHPVLDHSGIHGRDRATERHI